MRRLVPPTWWYYIRIYGEFLRRCNISRFSTPIRWWKTLIEWEIAQGLIEESGLKHCSERPWRKVKAQCWTAKENSMGTSNLTFSGSIESIMLGFGPVVLGAKVVVVARVSTYYQCNSLVCWCWASMPRFASKVSLFVYRCFIDWINYWN